MPVGPVLLDTDVLSEVSRGNPAVVARARGYLVEFGRLTISAVTVFERLRGYQVALREGKPYHRQLAAFEALVANSLVVPFDEDAASVAATLWASATPKQRKSLGDMLIAATAIARHLPLVTNNRKDFAGLTKASGLSLSLVDWSGKSAKRS